jgi:hypothetical protein
VSCPLLASAYREPARSRRSQIMVIFFRPNPHACQASLVALEVTDRCDVQTSVIIVFANCVFAAPSIPIEIAREQEQEINRAEVPPSLFTWNYYFSH